MAAKLSLYMPHSQIANQIEQLLWNKFINTIFSLESYQMTALWPIEHLLYKFFFQFILSLEMTDMWPNYSKALPFYASFSNSIPNWSSFVKEALWFNV